MKQMMDRFKALLIPITAAVTIMTPLLHVEAQEGAYLQHPGIRTMQVRTIASAPILDGRLPESEWPAAAFQGDFWQLVPVRGGRSIADPLVAVASDGEALYVAFIAPLPNGEPPVAGVTRRDAEGLGSDDFLGVLFDTYQDGRTAFVFFANALGTQGDMKIANDGETEDQTWDTEWEVATAIEADRWTAEFRIPFSSILFPAESVEWGVNFARGYPAELSYNIWNGPIEKRLHISRSGRLEDVPIPDRPDPISITPYLSMRHATDSVPGVDAGWHPEIGADLQSDIGSTWTLNATFNPDFASVEGDREQINLTPFETSFPEKRRFFIEGNDLWSNRIRTFYTRRIGQIDGGAKLVGRSGRNTLAALMVREASFADDPETVTTNEHRPPATWGVFRVRRDVMENSTVGLLAVNRHGPDGDTGTLGSDIYLNLANDWYITGQAVISWPDPSLATGGYFLRAERKTNIYDYHLRYTELGERFRDNANAVGFIRDDNRRELDAAIAYTWWREAGPFQFIEYDSNYNIYWSRTDGRLRNWEIRQEAMIYLNNDLSFTYEGSFENQEPDQWFSRHYYNREHLIEAGYKTEEWASTEVGYSWGWVYDSDYSLWEFSINRVLLPKMTASYSFSDLRLKPDPEEDSARRHVLRLEYAFTPDLYWRVFGQYNEATYRFYLYSVFGWRYDPPFSAVYITYSRDEFPHGFIPGERDTRPLLFLKVSHQIGR
ncbi:DUF5916 domain-containing protein [Gemmatimonadota bacterium]